MKAEGKKDEKVNVNNDAEMVMLGIRPRLVRPRDSSVWTKTEKEREAWKKHRRFPAPNYGWAPPTKVSRFIGRLIVHVKGMDKTTFSHNCPESDLSYILSKYKNEHYSITKAFWNGKEINPERFLQQAV